MERERGGRCDCKLPEALKLKMAPLGMPSTPKPRRLTPLRKSSIPSQT